MKSVIGFIAFLIGGAGVGGTDHAICSVIALAGLVILWKEGKKIDAPTDQSRSVYQ